ncbi:zf-DHHC-domain-containing protein [Aaosphaeria arxii CBS 175.79]|uniref:Palmitoyltransferase n=1 Tax=Aaosphaeria arxii CBS 175.79 TaxID=1450172 RepID=A0A6A5XP38_9PLEO|nr:zf-DHHC-domain-containing protein [Aaosphaeria arxii CBS 175.79]KAF2014490.1 zf-DHHC-domain-containing protein [Aaosphaeria arxii CBS 175.79]
MAISEERQNAMDKKANQIMSVVLPLVEAAGMGLATYVVVYRICLNALIQPIPKYTNHGFEPRRATGIGLLVVYLLLLVVFCITFLRLLQVIWTNPGVTPLGEPSSEKSTASTKHYDRLDAYICDYQGWPLWCDKCHSFKPDRTHHSKQLGRCVRRMDHYCPYAGGIISETTHKFFVQFLFYGFLYTGFTLIVVAYFLAERHRVLHSAPGTWVVAVALAGLFFLFTFGMFATTFYNLSINQTTVEVMQRDFVHQVALRGGNLNPPNTTSDQSVVLCEVSRSPTRSYIVVQTELGTGLWDLGPLANIRSIMGDSLIEWFVPLRMSPCLHHRDHSGEFPWGRKVVRLMEEHGAGTSYRRTRRRSGGAHAA